MDNKFKIGDLFTDNKGIVYEIISKGDLDYFFSDRSSVKDWIEKKPKLADTVLKNGFFNLKQIYPEVMSGNVLFWAIIPLTTKCDLVIGTEERSKPLKLHKADNEMVKILYQEKKENRIYPNK